VIRRTLARCPTFLVDISLHFQAFTAFHCSYLKISILHIMVTGVETAGLVLGSLPLLIAALEHYEDIVRPTREFFKWGKHRRKLVQELYTLRASYEQAIEILLKPIAEPEDSITMMDNPRSDLWKVGPVADRLRDTFGSAYKPLIFTIEEISEILGSIAAHLNIKGSQQVWHSPLPRIQAYPTTNSRWLGNYPAWKYHRRKPTRCEYSTP
jgi:hypothetical protein